MGGRGVVCRGRGEEDKNEEDDKDEYEQNEEYGQRAVVFIFGSPLFRKKDSFG